MKRRRKIIGGLSQIAKSEAANLPLHGHRAKLAFLSALVHSAGSIIISDGVMRLSLASESDSIKSAFAGCAEEIYKDLKFTFGAAGFLGVGGEAIERLLMDCHILIKDTGGERHIAAGIPKALVADTAGAASYVRGAFLGCGSVSDSGGYHFELAFSNPVIASDMQKLLERFDVSARGIQRKDKFVVYLKDAESVSDALALVGASKAVLKLNSEFASRQVIKSTQRTINCDMANIDKTVRSSALQTEAIELLRKNGTFAQLDDKLKEAAILRESAPESTLSELADAQGISKSGLRHRLNRIVALAFDDSEM
jgi:DNA-binding protein WhiA